MRSRSCSGMTTVEMIVAITILFALILFVTGAFSPQGGCISPAGSTQTLSNMRQLHMVVQQMTLDNEVAGKPLRWTCKGSEPVTREELIRTILDEPYLPEADLKKILSVKSKYGAVNEDGYSIFAVTPDDLPATVMMATKNWSSRSDKLSKEPPGKENFVVFRKDGSGAVLSARQAGQNGIIGEGGMHEYLPLK